MAHICILLLDEDRRLMHEIDRYIGDLLIDGDVIGIWENYPERPLIRSPLELNEWGRKTMGASYVILVPRLPCPEWQLREQKNALQKAATAGWPADPYAFD